MFVLFFVYFSVLPHTFLLYLLPGMTQPFVMMMLVDHKYKQLTWAWAHIMPGYTHISWRPTHAHTRLPWQRMLIKGLITSQVRACYRGGWRQEEACERKKVAQDLWHDKVVCLARTRCNNAKWSKLTYTHTHTYTDTDLCKWRLNYLLPQSDLTELFS